MADDMAFTHFLGEREERFKLTPKLIPELERLTGCGIGVFFKRLCDAKFSHADILQTVRLGLIGGGMAPETAARLTETYVEDRPIIEVYPIALATLERLWYGAPVADALAKEISKSGAADAL